MTEQAGRWSSSDVDRRFGPGARPTELAELAATLDGVLDRLSAVLRHERQLSGELSHELRTPLAAVVAEVELLDSRPRRPDELAAGHAAVLAAAERMSRVLESLLTAARATADGPPGRCDVLTAVHAAVELAAPPEGVVRVEAPGPVPAAGVDAALLERALGPVLDNAVRHCRSSVLVRVCAGATGPEVAVQDDGPGVEPALADTLFDPGVRGEDGHGGAGLGLALARRLARAGGGDLVLAPGRAGAGARLVLSLPPG
jgi:signal transduction histidine kinase